MRNIIKTTLALFIICLGVGISLAFADSLTSNIIVIRTQEDLAQQKKEVIPEADKFSKVSDWEAKTSTEIIKEVFLAEKSGVKIGYTFSAVTKGYGGDIKIVIGVDLNGKIEGVKVGDNKETPGLGSKAKDAKFTDQYKGKQTNTKLVVVKGKAASGNEIDAISGATITSKAVTVAVQAAVDLSNKLVMEGGSTK